MGTVTVASNGSQQQWRSNLIAVVVDLIVRSALVWLL